MRTSPRLVTALTMLVVSGLTFATAALHAAPNDPSPNAIPSLHTRSAQALRPPTPAFNLLPKSHTVSAFLLHSGPVTLFTDTRGRVIGRSNPADGSQVVWSDQSRSGPNYHTRIAW